jgi:hypothetical protein
MALAAMWELLWKAVTPVIAARPAGISEQPA